MAYDGYEEEIEKLKKDVANEEIRTAECQREINRLRAIVINYVRIEEAITKPDYKKLFGLWGDFADEESPAEVVDKAESLGQVDGVSFMAYCAGFAKAAELFKEE
jgi:hypothetical protein